MTLFSRYLEIIRLLKILRYNLFTSDGIDVTVKLVFIIQVKLTKLLCYYTVHERLSIFIFLQPISHFDFISKFHCILNTVIFIIPTA